MLKEPSNRDVSLEHPNYMFSRRDTEFNACLQSESLQIWNYFSGCCTSQGLGGIVWTYLITLPAFIDFDKLPKIMVLIYDPTRSISPIYNVIST